MTNPLVAFYVGEATDDQDRLLAEIWNFSHTELEDVHDYIQWLFPLAERSAFNATAPVLDDPTIARFQRDPSIREHVERSLAVMLDFYGLAAAGDQIVRGPNFPARAKHWLASPNHNFLRLTRILKSLSLLGFPDRARQLLTCLEELYETHERVIGERTLGFWQRAVG